MKIVIIFLFVLIISISKSIGQDEKIYTVVEEMPVLYTCEGDIEAKVECTKQKMLDYIYSKLVYPPRAIQNGVWGKCSVQFIVNKDGYIDSTKVDVYLGFDTKDSLELVLEKIRNLQLKFIPGKNGGKPVNVLYTLPVDFSIKDEIPRLDLNIDKSQDPFDDDIYKVVEQMPRFPGCESIEGDNDQKMLCAREKMLEFIYANLKYPAKARENGVEGMSVGQFIVSKDGSIEDIKIVRDIGAETGNAVIKVLEEMNNLPQKWTPGYQRGKAVKVLYTLPVKFTLTGKSNIKGTSLNQREYDPDKKKSQVVIISNLYKSKIAIWNARIYQDDEMILMIKNNRYISYELDPGEYSMFVHIGKKKKYKSTFNLSVQKGETVYLKIIEDKEGFEMLKPYKFVELSQEKGKEAISKLKKSK